MTTVLHAFENGCIAATVAAMLYVPDGHVRLSVAWFPAVLAAVHLVMTSAVRWPLYPLYGVFLLGLARTLFLQGSITESTMTVGLLNWSLWALELLAIVMTSFLTNTVLQPVLPAPSGPYAVGFTDAEFTDPQTGARVQGRIVYPADLVDGAPYEEEPYLPYGMESAKAFINFGAPDILKRIPYILFHWTLVKLDAVRNAPVLPVARTLKKEKFPIVICSHGNGGTREVSSAIHHDLASHGRVVIMLEHRDGSAQLTRDVHNEIYPYDATVALPDAKTGTPGGYVWARRKQLETRANEVFTVLAAIAAGHFPSFGPTVSSMELHLHEVALWSEITLLGHSFGGATMLTVAARLAAWRATQPASTLRTSVVVHDPAIDWMPDDARAAVTGDVNASSTPAEGVMVVRRGLVSALQESLRTIPVLAMYGTQWIAWDWGEHRAVKAAVQCADTNPTMPVAHIFGRGSVFCAVEEAGHQSFTDMAFLLPPRVARMIHFFGDRDPVDTHKTIANLTNAFLDHHHSSDTTTQARIRAFQQPNSGVTEFESTV